MKKPTLKIEPKNVREIFWLGDTKAMRNSIRLAKSSKKPYGHLLKSLKNLTTQKLKMEAK